MIIHLTVVSAMEEALIPISAEYTAVPESNIKYFHVKLIFRPCISP